METSQEMLGLQSLYLAKYTLECYVLLVHTEIHGSPNSQVE